MLWRALAFFPLTAILHHAVFYPPTCILNHFGEDYYPAVIVDWLANDPSPWLALVASVALCFSKQRWIDRAAMSFVLAFLPLTLWIWDIPFSGRVICDLGHDGRWPIRTLYLYVFGLLVWPLIYWFSSRNEPLRISTP